MAEIGGGGRIRTFEVCDGRFTVCSLWPLGNPTGLDGADYRNRTGDLLITSQLLYLLSEVGTGPPPGTRTSHTQLKGLTLFPDELVTVGGPCWI